jgi:hypothetical protein
MKKCNFCERQDFASRQSVYAHLKWCRAYRQHKHKRNTALGTSLRQAVPKAPVHETIPSPVQSPPLPPPADPFAAIIEALQRGKSLSPNVGDTQETPQQKRRRLLQAAKSQVVDHYRSFTGTVTAEMRAAAKLTIERELRNEPLEELPSPEVSELAGGVRDRIYTAFLRRQEQDARRTKEVEERKRITQGEDERMQRDAERTQQERRKRKAAILDEARRRAVRLLKTRSRKPLEPLQAMEDVCTQLDEALTGAEPLSEAYAAIEALLQARVAEWDASDAAREAKRQEEWWELATGVVVLIVLVVLCVKAPEILNWLLKIFSPEPTPNSGATGKPTGEAPCPPSGEPTPVRPVRRIRRPPPPPGSPLSPASSDNTLPSL